MTTAADIDDWAAGLEQVSDRIARRFGGAEPRRRAVSDRRGLLAPVERKNGGNWPRRPALRHRTGCRSFSRVCNGMPARSGMTCQPMGTSIWVIRRRYGCWTKPVS